MPRKQRTEEQRERQYDAQRWCFTINLKGREINETCEYPLPEIEPPVGYRIYQLEAGRSQTPHLQGYLELTKPLTRSEVKELPGMRRAHLEPANGDFEDNKRYCSKPEGRIDGPFEEGDACVQPGKRSDLIRLKDAIDRGASDRELFDEHFSSAVRYIRGLQCYRGARVPPRTAPPRIIVYYGDAGSGKSSRAFRIVRGRGWTCYVKANDQWWDGYYGQDAIIWDEFDPAVVPARSLLRYIDRYECRVQVKGTSVQLNSPVMFITTNVHPRGWYPKEDEVFQKALMRRLEKVVEFKFKGEQDEQMPHECTNEEDSMDEGEVELAAQGDIDSDNEEIVPALFPDRESLTPPFDMETPTLEIDEEEQELIRRAHLGEGSRKSLKRKRDDVIDLTND